MTVRIIVFSALSLVLDAAESAGGEIYPSTYTPMRSGPVLIENATLLRDRYLSQDPELPRAYLTP